MIEFTFSATQPKARLGYALLFLVYAVSAQTLTPLEPVSYYADRGSHKDYPINNAFDGDPATQWISAYPSAAIEGGLHQMIRIDMGLEKEFNHIRIENGSHIDTPLRIFASNLLTDELRPFLSYEVNFYSATSGYNRAPVSERSYELVAEVPFLTCTDDKRGIIFNFLTVKKRYVYIVLEGYVSGSEKSCPAIGEIAVLFSDSNIHTVASASANDLTAPVFNVFDYGAMGDGETEDTEAIQRAVDVCSDAGGGTVWFRSGIFKSAAVCLKSNVRIHIDTAATVLAFTDMSGFDSAEQMYAEKYPGDRECIAIFYAENQENIVIDGRGTIHGNQFSQIFERHKRPSPPYLLRFTNCRNIITRDVVLKNAVHWVQPYSNCDNVLIENIIIDNVGTYPSDGISILECRDVIVRGNYVHTDDDAIVIKSRKDVMSSNILVEDNVVNSMRNRGINIGTETRGPIRDVTIRNNIVTNAGKGGLGLQAVDGTDISNVKFQNIFIRGAVPLYIRLGNRDRFNAGTVASIEDVIFENIYAFGYSDWGCLIAGIPGHPIKNVTFKNMQIDVEGGKKDIPTDPAELEDAYPKENMFGVLPAYGFYVRHAENITFDKVDIRSRKPDVRKWLVAQQSSDVRVHDSKEFKIKPFEKRFHNINILSDDSELIDGLICYDSDVVSAAVWSIKKDLKLGDRVYGDSHFVFSYLPQYLKRSSRISPSLASGLSKNNKLAEFKMKQDGVVYIAFPSYLDSKKPQWLDSWESVDDNIMVRQGGNSVLWKFCLLKRNYKAGERVVLNAGGMKDYNESILRIKPTGKDGFQQRAPIIYPGQYFVIIN